MQDPTPLKQAGDDSTLRELVKEAIELRNGSLKILNEMEEENPLSVILGSQELTKRADRFEQLLVQMGHLVGVECLQSNVTPVS